MEELPISLPLNKESYQKFWELMKIAAEYKNQTVHLDMSFEKLNEFGQKYLLRPKDTERADMDGWKMPTETVDRFLTLADELHVLGGQTPATNVNFNSAFILGAAQPTIEKRVKSLENWVNNGGKITNVFALGSDRKMWTYDKNGVEKEPVVFEMVAERIEKPVEEVKQEARQFITEDGKVAEIAKATAEHFETKYGIKWPTEDDCIKYVLSRSSLKDKVQLLSATAKKGALRATTDENAASALSHVKSGDKVIVVSNDSFASYQSEVFRAKLPEGTELHTLADKLTPATDEVGKRKQVETVADSLGRYIYTVYGQAKEREQARLKKLEELSTVNTVIAGVALTATVGTTVKIGNQPFVKNDFGLFESIQQNQNQK